MGYRRKEGTGANGNTGERENEATWERETKNEERGTENEERGTTNDERGTGNEERGTRNEERKTGNGVHMITRA